MAFGFVNWFDVDFVVFFWSSSLLMLGFNEKWQKAPEVKWIKIENHDPKWKCGRMEGGSENISGFQNDNRMKIDY